jgi:hypothetical protein
LKPSAPLERVAAIVKMRPALAAAIKGKHVARIPLPPLVPPVRVGERLMLIEWAGATTGRADVLCVEEIQGYEEKCLVRRSWCWMQGKHDTDLSSLSLAVDETRAVPLIG